MNREQHLLFCVHNIAVLQRRSVKGSGWHAEADFWRREADLAALTK